MQPASENGTETRDCYVYCFCSAPAPDVGNVTGIGDSEVCAIEYKGIIAITAHCSRPPEPSIPNVVAHNRVVDSILKSTTPLPCRFGTTLSLQDLEIYVKTRGEAVKALLSRFEGCVEMTLRIALAAIASAGPFEDATRAVPDHLPLEPSGPGARFLEEKIRESNRQRRANRQAQAIQDWADGRFRALVRDSVRRPNPDTTLAAHIAHLVDRPRLRHYRGLLATAQSERPDLQLTISGPWAPYSFAILDNSGEGH